jgi:hypothetical protein
MACVNPDGTLTGSAKAILEALRTAETAERIAPIAGLPLFRVRSALRELVTAGLVGVGGGAGGWHHLTEAGEARLQPVEPVAATVRT